ncbi:MAG: hypothetical protein SFX74_06615 [Fimbriimonadaceae bacterium]|nr:hypothetical protein [Fimbriimonadaceae bacterium]
MLTAHGEEFSRGEPGPAWPSVPHLIRIGPEQPGRRHLGFPLGGPSDPDAFALLGEFADAIAELHGHPIELPAYSAASVPGSVIVLGDRPVVNGRPGNAWVSRSAPITIHPGQGRLVTIGHLPDRNPPAPHVTLAELPAESGPLRVVPLPEFDADLRGLVLQLSPRSNRVGTRCVAIDRLRHDIERPSQVCDRGHVQVTPAGEVIVLGPDGPTIGGYPRLGALIRADWGRFARAGWTTPVSFALVTFEDAERMLAAHRLRLAAVGRQWQVALGG